MTKAADIVADYLAAMERRDLEGAKRFLGPGFSMTFPGGALFHAPEELVEWGSKRYSAVGKTHERIEETAHDDCIVVYCSGTLHGLWPDGRPFSGIRFIDRFEVSGGKITKQEVWNDLAEVRFAPKG